MSRRMWKAVEAKAGKIKIEKTKGKRGEKQEEKEKEKKEKKKPKRERIIEVKKIAEE